MTDDRLALQTLLEKTPDANYLREMIGFAAQRLMELEIESCTGASHGKRSPERLAQRNGSAEAEMRAILEAAVRPEGRLRLGTALSEMSRKIGLTNADVEALEHGRDARPAEPMHFE